MLQPRFDFLGALLLNVDVTFLAQYMFLRFTIYCVLCGILEREGKITEAIECFRQMQSDATVGASVCTERAGWELSEWSPSGTAENCLNIHIGFQRRCYQRYEKLADDAMGSENYTEAADHLSTMLSLDTKDRVDTLIKRSRARVVMESWEDALRDADEVYSMSSRHEDYSWQSVQVVKLDPSSYRGHEQRHVVLHGAKRYTEAVSAFDKMLSTLKESSDGNICGESFLYHRARLL